MDLFPLLFSSSFFCKCRKWFRATPHKAGCLKKWLTESFWQPESRYPCKRNSGMATVCSMAKLNGLFIFAVVRFAINVAEIVLSVKGD